MKNTKNDSKLPSNIDLKNKEIINSNKEEFANQQEENHDDNNKKSERKTSNILKTSGMLDAYKCKIV